MDSEMIKQFADEAFKQTVKDDQLYLLLILFISFLVGLGGAYCGAYMKKRGEDKAVTEGFNELKKQNVELAKAIEEVKSEKAKQLEIAKVAMDAQRVAQAVVYTRELEILGELWQLAVQLKSKVEDFVMVNDELYTKNKHVPLGDKADHSFEVMKLLQEYKLLVQQRMPFFDLSVATQALRASEECSAWWASAQSDLTKAKIELQDLAVCMVSLHDAIRDRIDVLKSGAS